MFEYTFLLKSYARLGERLVYADHYEEAEAEICQIVEKSKQYFQYILKETNDPAVSQKFMELALKDFKL